MGAPGPEPGIGKIAVLRANAIGDFICILPALAALRAAYPAAELVLLGRAWHSAFLTGRPGPVDRVVVVPPTPGVDLPAGATPGEAEAAPFFAAMREECFDLALQLHGGGRFSNPFVGRLGARLTAGLRAEDAPPLDRWIRYRFYQPEVLRHLEVVSLVGAAAVGLEPRLTLTAADRAEAAGRLPEGDGPLVALHPGATDPRRCWPPAKFAAVGDALAAAGARIVVTGGATERPLAAAVAGAMRLPATELSGGLSLGGLAGLLAACSLVVSNDSGPLHLAVAVGTATVGIYWCGNLLNWAPLTRARHRPSVSWQTTCPVCGADMIGAPCGHTASLVADVPVEEVLASARDLLATVPPAF